jgi:hypothetical protein
MAGSSKSDASKKPADVSKKKPEGKKNPPADSQISNKDLDKVSGGRASTGYGTVDYGTRTSHGGD